MRTRISVAAALVVAAATVTGVATAVHTSARQRRAGYAGTIAFVRAGEHDALYVIYADGRGLRRITPPGIDVSDYAWSPHARRIAYIDGGGSLWLVRLDGEGRRRLLAGSTLASSDLSWSPNGRAIAISSRGAFGSCAGKQIYVVPIDGAARRKVPGASPACDVFAWSPRGNLIAYSDTDGRGFWVVHPDGSGRRRVSSQGGAGWVRWSADGNQLAFAVAVRKPNRKISRNGGIAVVDVDGRDFHIVTRHANNEDPAVWSPTGHRLLYGRAKDGGIYVIGANGRNDRRVTTESSDALAWSPDGSSIIYANRTAPLSSCRCEQQLLYEVGVDGRGKVQLTIPGTSDFDPSWVASQSRATKTLTGSTATTVPLHLVTAKSIAAMMISHGIPARVSASRAAFDPYLGRQRGYSSEVSLADRRFAPPPNHPWGLATSVAGIECYASGSDARRRYRELDRTRYFLGSTEGHDYVAGQCVLRLSNDLVDPKWVHDYRDAFEAATKALTGGVAVPYVVQLRLDQAERVLTRDHLGYKGYGDDGGAKLPATAKHKYEICFQEPGSGKLVSRGRRVALFLTRPGECYLDSVSSKLGLTETLPSPWSP
jgi:Tol biopolymer transport system component